MKKILTSIALASLSLGGWAANTIFSADLSTATQEDFDAWTVIDVNGDEKTWTFADDATPSHAFYSYHSSNQADDWFISPAIEIPSDGMYVVSYNYRGSSYGEAFEVWTGTAPTVEGMTDKVADHPLVIDNIEGNLAFVDAAAGPLYVGFHCVSQPDKFRLYINSLEVLDASNPVDIQVAEILSPATGENLGEESVTISLTNTGRVDVDSFDVAYSLNDGEPIVEHVNANLAVGATIEYTFNTKADLSLGHYTHTLKAWTMHPDDLNPANDAAEVKVRHIAPASVPYFMGFEPDEDTSDIRFFNLNEDSGDWSINIGGGWFGNFARTGYACLAYNYDSDNAADDWAILEPIQMEAGHYVMKYWYCATDGHTERMRVCYGFSPEPEAMTNVIAELDAITNSKYQEAIHIFELNEAAPVYIGFYCYSDADENWLLVDDLTIENVDPNTFDMIVSSVANPTEYMRAGSSTDVNFTLQNVGIIDATTNVNFYLDGELLTSKDYSLRAMEILNVTEAALLENLTTGFHTFKLEAVCDADNHPENNVLEVEFQFLEEAVCLWDFEDGLLPEDLTYRVEDSGENHPNAGDEYNELGFGIFNLEHPVLGTHALAVNTWFTNDATADRYIVLPQIKVTGDNACFVWNANSYNPSYPERYEIRISKGEDKWWDYNTVFSVPAEEITPQTHGIDLSEYKDQNIYVAVHVTTSNGEALILDNLGLYGDIQPVSTGIDNVMAAQEFNVVINANTLRVLAADTAEIAIYSNDGKHLMSINGTSADLSGLNAGIYIAKVTTVNGTKTLKFVR